MRKWRVLPKPVTNVYQVPVGRLEWLAHGLTAVAASSQVRFGLTNHSPADKIHLWIPQRDSDLILALVAKHHSYFSQYSEDFSSVDF